MSSAFLSDGYFGEELGFNKAINYWNTAPVTDMGSIFYRDRVFHQPINDWNVASVANMDEMFVGASDFNQPLDDVLLNY